MPQDLASLYLDEELKNSFEGVIEWMYLDTNGHLTIGMGHLLAYHGTTRNALEKAIRSLWNYGSGPYRVADVDRDGQSFGMQLGSSLPTSLLEIPGLELETPPEMCVIPTVLSTRNMIAFPEKAPWEIMADEAEEVMNQPFGRSRGAGYFDEFSTFRMRRQDILALRAADVAIKIRELTARITVDGQIVSEFRNFSSFPIGAQLAILDLSFQAGVRGLARHTTFRQAVGKLDWKLASENCPAIAQPSRTRWRKEQLLKASEAKPAAAATTVPPAIRP